MSKTNGYYDIEEAVESCLLENGFVDELFRLKDLKQRKLFINSEIDQFTVFDVVKHIMQYNKEDEGKNVEDRRPIFLYLVSRGGELDTGFELIDVIQKSITPVYTINLGYQYSMGFYIGLAGHRRFAMPNAKFLLHDGSSFIYDSSAKVQDRIKFQSKVEDKIKDYVIENSKLTPEEYDEKLRVEWYLFADEAKERGFVDYIIGIDCGIDAIV